MLSLCASSVCPASAGALRMSQVQAPELRGKPVGNHLQGLTEISDSSAALLAELLTITRGAGAVGTTPFECKRVTPKQLLHIHEVRWQCLHDVNADGCTPLYTLACTLPLAWQAL